MWNLMKTEGGIRAHCGLRRGVAWLITAVLLVGFGACLMANTAAVEPGHDLQAVLDRGDDLVLQQGAVYPVSQTLRYTRSGQRIYTEDARFPAQFATLRLANPDLTRLIYAGGVEGASLQHVICDGRRFEFGVPPREKPGGLPQPSLVLFGEQGGHNQVVRECIFINARSWSTLKVHEGARNVRVENNFIFGAGADCRGNGREATENRIKWGDGITFAARDSLIRNNLVIDPTDVGLVLFGSPGTVAEQNVVAAISRESLGGVNLVDPIGYYKLNDVETDYRGVRIQGNMVDAFGARVHIGYPMGAAPWAPRNKGKVLRGAEVTGNLMSGGAGAYGFVVHGVSDWTVSDNNSTASYSGIADGLGPDNRAHQPAAFVYDPSTVERVNLQAEFKPCDPHIEHLLRCNHGPMDDQGYRIYAYGDAEAEAVVQGAHLEMLGRLADKDELSRGIELLQANTVNADGLRRQLMDSQEFRTRFGEIPSEDLHGYRARLWFDLYAGVIRDHVRKAGHWPRAREVYGAALEGLRIENRKPPSLTQLDERAQ